MIPVFIGWDSREAVAWHTLAHSIIRRTKTPVAITPIGNAVLSPTVWWRQKGPKDSTEFSNARFLIPHLMDYRGWAIFLDCDMVMHANIGELWNQRDDSFAIQVVKHDHRPLETRKFLNAEQTTYSRKNWSSLMLLNCGHPQTRTLTKEYVNTAPGIDMHGMAWVSDPALIGDITGGWNVLAGPELQPYGYPYADDYVMPRLIHFTRGGPWHGVYDRGWREWTYEFRHMIGGSNPCARTEKTASVDGLEVSVRYRIDERLLREEAERKAKQPTQEVAR